MKTISKILSILMMGLITIYGCGKNPAAPDPINQIHVSAFLWGNKALRKERAIFLARTGAVDKKYNISDHAIRNANVTIKHVETDSIFVLKHDDDNPGNWYNEALVPRPKNSYHLRIETATDTVIAMTKVPPALTLHTQLLPFSYDHPDTNYEHHQGLSYRKPIFIECEDPEQVVMEDAYCHEEWEDAKYVQKFFGQDGPTNQNEYDGGANREPRHIIDGGQLKDFNRDPTTGYYVLDWYSSMIWFYGTYSMQIIALDDNYHNYVFSSVKEWTSGIVGGVGVFGSVTGEVYKFDILEQ